MTGYAVLELDEKLPLVLDPDELEGVCKTYEEALIWIVKSNYLSFTEGECLQYKVVKFEFDINQAAKNALDMFDIESNYPTTIKVTKWLDVVLVDLNITTGLNKLMQKEEEEEPKKKAK